MNRRERWLILLLRLSAFILLLALVPAFMPFHWMQAAHRAIGLGELSTAPLTHYLTRSLSALYAFHGAITLLLSFDVRRYLPLIRFIGFADVAFGGFMLGLDLFGGMPPAWTLSEGPFIIGAGVLVLWLQRGVAG